MNKRTYQVITLSIAALSLLLVQGCVGRRTVFGTGRTDSGTGGGDGTRWTSVESIPPWEDTSLPFPPDRPSFQPERPIAPPVETTTYIVVRGDTISGIAQAHGVRTRDVLSANGLTMETAKLIRPGQTIYIPAGGTPTPRSTTPIRQTGGGSSIQRTSTIPTDGIHTVASGEFPGSIAQMYRVKLDDLMAANNLTPESSRRLMVGDKLKIPTGGTIRPDTGTATPGSNVIPPPPPTPSSDPFNFSSTPTTTLSPTMPITTGTSTSSPSAADRMYTVQDGDDVYTVSIKFGVSATELRQHNNLTTSDLTPGQRLRIPPQR